MATGAHDVRAHVLQIAAVYDKEFLNQVEAEYGLIRSQPKADERVKVMPLVGVQACWGPATGKSQAKYPAEQSYVI
jgi:hypothetical protein